MSEPIKKFTSCTLCPQKFAAFGVDIPIIGEAPTDTVKRLVYGLKDHAQRKHPKHFDSIKDLSQNFFGYLVTALFETEDAHLALAFDIARAGLHKMTRRPFSLPDGSIREKLAELGLTGEQLEKVCQYVMNVRDAYDEEGMFSPEAHRQNLLAQPNGQAQ